MYYSLFQFQSNRHPSIWILWEIIIKTDLCCRRNMWICCWMRMFHFKSYISSIFDEYMDDFKLQNKNQVWFVEEFCAIMVKTVTDIASNFNVITTKKTEIWIFFIFLMEFKSLGEEIFLSWNSRVWVKLMNYKPDNREPVC